MAASSGGATRWICSADCEREQMRLLIVSGRVRELVDMLLRD